MNRLTDRASAPSTRHSDPRASADTRYTRFSPQPLQFRSCSIWVSRAWFLGSSMPQKSMLSSLSKKIRLQAGHWWALRMVSSQQCTAAWMPAAAAAAASRAASMSHTSPPPAMAFTSRAVKYRGR